MAAKGIQSDHDVVMQFKGQPSSEDLAKLPPGASKPVLRSDGESTVVFYKRGAVPAPIIQPWQMLPEHWLNQGRAVHTVTGHTSEQQALATWANMVAAHLNIPGAVPDHVREAYNAMINHQDPHGWRIPALDLHHAGFVVPQDVQVMAATKKGSGTEAIWSVLVRKNGKDIVLSLRPGEDIASQVEKVALGESQVDAATKVRDEQTVPEESPADRIFTYPGLGSGKSPIAWLGGLGTGDGKTPIPGLTIEHRAAAQFTNKPTPKQLAELPGVNAVALQGMDIDGNPVWYGVFQPVVEDVILTPALGQPTLLWLSAFGIGDGETPIPGVTRDSRAVVRFATKPTPEQLAELPGKNAVALQGKDAQGNPVWYGVFQRIAHAPPPQTPKPPVPPPEPPGPFPTRKDWARAQSRIRLLLLTVIALVVVVSFVIVNGTGVGIFWKRVGPRKFFFVFADSTGGKAHVLTSVRAEEFDLVDSAGNTRAMLGTLSGKPGLVLHDQNGNTRAVLGLDSDGTPELLLIDQNGNTGVALDLFMGPELSLSDTNGTERVELSAGILELLPPGLTLNDRNGKTRAVLSTTDSEPTLDLYDQNGNVRAELGVNDSGEGLRLNNGSGRMTSVWGAP